MPKSKSKRKSVLKREAVERAVDARIAAERRAADSAYDRLRATVIDFHRKWPDDEHAGFLLDILFDRSFSWSSSTGGELQAVPELDLVKDFCEPVENMDEYVFGEPFEDMVEYTEADATSALERLVNLGKIVRSDGFVLLVI